MNAAAAFDVAVLDPPAEEIVAVLIGGVSCAVVIMKKQRGIVFSDVVFATPLEYSPVEWKA